MTTENLQFLQQAIDDGLFDSRDDALNKAIQLLRQQVASNGNGAHETTPTETIEAWTQRFDAWVDSHDDVVAIAVDGRETIYAGRGE